MSVIARSALAVCRVHVHRPLTASNLRRMSAAALAGPGRGWRLAGLAGAALVSSAGLTYVYEKYKQPKPQDDHMKRFWDQETQKFKPAQFELINEDLTKEQLSAIESARVARVKPGVKLPGMKLKLFQYQSCPYCCKVRAALDFFGLEYEVVEVDALRRAALRWSAYRKVPVLVAIKEENPKDEARAVLSSSMQLNDSTLIVSILGTYFRSHAQDTLNAIASNYQAVSFTGGKPEVVNKYFLMMGEEAQDKESVRGLAEERKWRRWADETFIHVISPNVYRTLPEAVATFEHFSNVGNWRQLFPTYQTYLGNDCVTAYYAERNYSLFGRHLHRSACDVVRR